MLQRALLASALVLTVASAASAQTARSALPASSKVAELEQQISEAKAKAEAAQAAVAELEEKLAKAQTAAMDDLVRRATAGEEAALRAVLDLVNTETSFVAYEFGKIARTPDLKPFLRVLDQLWPAASPTAKGKFVWMLGVNGTAEAAARLRAVLAQETDATILGNAIFALSRCPFSAENLAAVQRFTSDTRSMAHSFGFHPHGWYGPSAEGGQSLATSRSTSWPRSTSPGTTPRTSPRLPAS